MPRQKKIWKTHSVFSAACLLSVTFFVRGPGWKIRAASFSAAGFGSVNAGYDQRGSIRSESARTASEEAKLQNFITEFRKREGGRTQWGRGELPL